MVTSAEDLKGLPISLTASGPSGFVASSYLMQAGLSLDDVVITDIPNTALVDAFNNDTLAASSSC